MGENNKSRNQKKIVLLLENGYICNNRIKYLVASVFIQDNQENRHHHYDANYDHDIGESATKAISRRFRIRFLEGSIPAKIITFGKIGQIHSNHFKLVIPRIELKGAVIEQKSSSQTELKGFESVGGGGEDNLR